MLYTVPMSDPYQIGGGFTDKELSAANWWVKYHLQLRRAGYAALIVIIIAVWGYVIWSLLDAYVISYPREQQISAIITDNQRQRARLTADAPQSLQIGPVAGFATTGDRRDFLTEITNANASWWAEFTYHFKIGEKTTPTRKGYILPNGQRYITEVGWKAEGTTGTPEIEITNLAWHRVNPTNVELDYANFLERRLQLQITQPLYTNNLKVGEQTVGQSSFNLHNASGYGFWSVDLIVVLFRSGIPVGVTQLNQTEIKPGEIRNISINWFDNLTGISNTVVQPNVNVLDPSVFLPPNRF